MVNYCKQHHYLNVQYTDTPLLGTCQHNEEDCFDERKENIVKQNDANGEHPAIEQTALDGSLDDVGLRLPGSSTHIPQPLLLPPLDSAPLIRVKTIMMTQYPLNL